MHDSQAADEPVTLAGRCVFLRRASSKNESEETAEKRYLQVIDLPLDERNQVIQELRLMGIIPGSLFPGLV
ncbi:MAG: hypothetical protein ACXU61_13045 [Croceibacterium sp.]